MKKQLQFLSIIATLLCLTNCQTEDIATETNNTHNEISIIRKKFSGFQKLPGLTNKVFEDSNLLKRGDSNNPLYDFEIDSTSVTQMEKEGNIYYTMAIYRATATEESFENLVVSDDAQQAYIFKYYPSAEYLQKKMWMQHPQYSGGIQITEIEYDQLSSRGSCVSVSISFCKNGPPGTRAGECCYASTADGGAGDGGAHVITITYEVCSDDEFLHITQIIADPSPGSSNGGGGAGGSGGGSPAPGSYPAGSPPTPTPSNPNSPLAPVTDPGGNPVLTEPVMLSNSIRLFVRDLDVLQKAWWNNPVNAVAVGIITDYLNDNGTNNIVDNDAAEFAEEAINALMDGGEVDFEKRILYTINKPCQKEIVKNVMTVSSSLTNLIKNTFDSSENVNLQFWNGDIPNADAYVNPLYTGTPSNFIIKVGFDDNFLDTGTNLAIVAVTLHEVVHAYFYSLYIRNQLIATNSSYNTLQNAFVAFYANANANTANPMNNELHNVMNSFMNKIANAIYNYAQSNNIGGVTPDYCLSLAWGTMEGTDLFEQMLTLDQQADANHTFMTEQNNTQYDTAFPIKGTPCQ